MTDQTPALMFNAVALALGDGWWLPLSQRKAVADALFAIIEPELQQLRASVPLICSDERHQAKVTALEAERDRLLDVLNGDDMPLLCPDCVCADCGGILGQHEPGGVCSCGCEPSCGIFVRDPELDTITESLQPAVGDPAAPALAHTVWHALYDAAAALFDASEEATDHA